jgi:hypothetical protein
MNNNNNLTYNIGVFLKGMKKITKTLGQNSRRRFVSVITALFLPINENKHRPESAL